MRPGNNQKIDSEYMREGTCSIFAWAEEIKCLLTDVIQNIILIKDNLNMHVLDSLYKKYLAEEACSYANG